MIPSHARERRKLIEERHKQIEAFAETFDGNRVEMGNPAIGIISSGVAYYYAKEVMPEASFFKLGVTYPLPKEALKKFAKNVKELSH